MAAIATLTFHTSPEVSLHLTEDELIARGVDVDAARDLEAHIRAFHSELEGVLDDIRFIA